jgi:hypothetical protein
VTIGGSIFLIAVGATLYFATNLHVAHVSIDTVGLILMIAGAAGLVLGFVQQAMWSRRSRRDVTRQPTSSALTMSGGVSTGSASPAGGRGGVVDPSEIDGILNLTGEDTGGAFSALIGTIRPGASPP